MPKLKDNSYQKRMWNYVPSKEDMQKVGWCLNHGIKISPLGIKDDSLHYYIDIEIGGKRSTSPNLFSMDTVSKTIYSYYFDYYEKYHDAVEWYKGLDEDEKKKIIPKSFKKIKEEFDKQK